MDDATKVMLDQEPNGVVRGKAVRGWCMFPNQGSLLLKLELHEPDPMRAGERRSLQVGLTEKQARELVEHLRMALARLSAQQPRGTA